MRALLQRVTRAEVRVGGERVDGVGIGLLILLGVGPTDDAAVGRALAQKVVDLRKDRIRFRELSDRCRMAAHEDFTLTRFGERLENVYQEVVKR